MNLLHGRLLTDVPAQKVFWLANGKSAKSLQELAAHVKDAEPWVFQHHVTEYKNDFYVWVKDIFQHDALAADVLACDEQKKMVECLQHWIVQAGKEQRQRYWDRMQTAHQTVTNPKLRIQKQPDQEGHGSSPQQGIAAGAREMLGFDMRRITKFQLPSEAEGAVQPARSTMFKYNFSGGEKVVKKVDAADKQSIIKQLKEVYQ